MPLKKQKSMATLAKETHLAVLSAEKSRTGAKFSKEDVRRLKLEFDEFDRDQSGLIDAHELSVALSRERKEMVRCHGLNHSSVDVTTPASRAAPGQSLLSAELFRAVGGKKREHAAVDLSGTIFAAFDANQDGVIAFKEILRVVYPSATAREIEEMVGWTTPQGLVPAARLR
jgi:Ca2+-binding EF-hand superfamily protein|mmetsp:Transcript_50194/g.139072  ORF Transcript_50194/g.139072 Transcript_50194/m.139072 type:complete len:172 (+) Transcript_50194:73-588(+)|eukprot:6588966-Prymnesium_polylepis.1